MFVLSVDACCGLNVPSFRSLLLPSVQVVVANSKRDGSTRDPREDEKLVRLFVICPKTYTEKDLREEFEVR